MKLHIYQPHPHLTVRQDTGPVRVADQHATSTRLARANARLAVGITATVGTMWMAYAFAALTVVSLPAAVTSRSALVIVAWIAQTFLQLVLLPVIIVGQNIQAKAADARAEQTFADVEALLHELAQIREHLHAQDEVLDAPRGGRVG